MLKRVKICWLIVLAFIGGCTSIAGWDTEVASDKFVDGTLVLGEAILIPSSRELRINQGQLKGWKQKMTAAGYQEADVKDGGLLTLWTYCYAATKGIHWCSHSGSYLVYVPAEFRNKIHTQVNMAKQDPAKTRGDLLEVRLTKNPDGNLIGRVVGIYADASDWKNCQVSSLSEPSALGKVVSSISTTASPYKSGWLECAMADNSGWIRQPVAGAPATEGAPVSEWIKLPK